MKEFLIEKFNNFNQDTVDAFRNRMISPLPTFKNPNIHNDSEETPVTIWGYTDQGFWYANKFQICFFEHNGIIHTVGSLMHVYYYRIYNALYTAGCPVIEPVAISEEQSEHVGKIYYAKFQTPNRAYGKNLVVQSLTNPAVDIKLYVRRYIDQIGNVYATLDKLNCNAVPICNLFNVAFDEDLTYIMFVEKFEPCEYYTAGVNIMLDRLEYYLTDYIFYSLTQDDKLELLTYAKHKWLQPGLEKELQSKLDEMFMFNDTLTSETKTAIIAYAKELCLPLTN